MFLETARKRTGTVRLHRLAGKNQLHSPQVHDASLYLSEPFRGRIKEAVEIIENADGIMRTGSHYDSAWGIAHVVRNEVRAMVAAFLRYEDCPGGSEKVSEYRVALRDYYAELNDLYDTPRDDAYRRARESFYNAHPELRPPSTKEIS